VHVQAVGDGVLLEATEHNPGDDADIGIRVLLTAAQARRLGGQVDFAATDWLIMKGKI
jgi:hypothetical protein